VRLRARCDLLGGRLAELAEKVGGDAPLRVDAALRLLDEELGCSRARACTGADLGDREVLLENDGDEIVVRTVALDAPLELVEGPVEELGDEAERGVEVLRLPAVEEERERTARSRRGRRRCGRG